MKVLYDEDEINHRFVFSTSPYMVEVFKTISSKEQKQIDKGIRAAAELLIKCSPEERQSVIDEFLN